MKKASKSTKKSAKKSAKRSALRGRQNYNRKTFTAALKKVRKARGLTQREAAAKVGCSQPCYCNVEKGLTAAGPKLLLRIAKAFGVRPKGKGSAGGKTPRKASAKKTVAPVVETTPSEAAAE